MKFIKQDVTDAIDLNIMYIKSKFNKIGSVINECKILWIVCGSVSRLDIFPTNTLNKITHRMNNQAL